MCNPTMLFSILIPTLDNRRELFDLLYEKIAKQIAQNSLQNEVEIIHSRDGGERSVGAKRNELLNRAGGKFVAFVDDDDNLSDRYVPLICNAINENPDIDCVGIKGEITFRGTNPRIFIHSVRYKEYFSKNGIYYRPPYHLNPIRRDIAMRYKFEEIDYSEDIDWAIRICRDGTLKKEYFIDKTIYYYHSNRIWIYQKLLDQSESLRHPLGLKLANRVLIRRWLKSLFRK